MKKYIRSSEDEDLMYDPYQGHTYLISGDDGKHKPRIQYANDPEEAIYYWFRIGKTHKFNTSIMTKLRSDAIKLCEAGSEDFLMSMYETYGCPYKIDYMIDACKEQVAKGCKYFYENEFGDQVHPFDIG